LALSIDNSFGQGLRNGFKQCEHKKRNPKCEYKSNDYILCEHKPNDNVKLMITLNVSLIL